ncbi:MAG: DUF2555 domain-containing protein, partial [Phormidesmis sp.]
MMTSAEHRSEKTTNPASQPNTSKASSHISAQEIAAMTPEDVAEIAQRLEQDAYSTPFEGLKDWHRLRAVAFLRSEL